MNRDPLEGVKACVFDAYGTLFDFAAAARSCRDVLGEATDKLTALWRDKQRQYTWLRAAQDRHADFWQVLPPSSGTNQFVDPLTLVALCIVGLFLAGSPCAISCSQISPTPPMPM